MGQFVNASDFLELFIYFAVFIGITIYSVILFLNQKRKIKTKMMTILLSRTVIKIIHQCRQTGEIQEKVINFLTR